VVVDPGVGTGRRAIAAETADYRFVAPDNGVLTLVFRETPPKRVVELTERRYARPTVSRTFEGRDRFAPAAAWLARGIQLSALGRPVTDYQTLEVPAPVVEGDRITGQVLHVDTFGNLVTNVDRKTVEKFTQGGAIQIDAGSHRINRLVATYGDIADDPCALFGSTDHLEIALHAASAAARLDLGRNAPIVITRTT
jgi:S-adenosylmethionine hydrolase